MGVEATWSLVDIPPGARDAAQAAARKEGLSVGEWLTRRIMRQFSELDLREQEESFAELRTHVAELAERLEVFQSQSRAEPMREAVRKLHQGLARLTDELVQTSGHSTIQLSALAGNVNVLQGTIDDVRTHTSKACGAFDQRIASVQQGLEGLDRRQSEAVRSLAAKAQSLAEKLDEVREQTCKSATAVEQHVASVQRGLVDADSRHGEACRSLGIRLESVAAKLADVRDGASQSTAAIDRRVSSLQQGLDRLDSCQSEQSRVLDARLENLTGKLDNVRTESTGMCGALDQRLLLVQQSLHSLDSRQADASQSLAGNLEAVTGGLEHVRTEISEASAALEQRMAQMQRMLDEFDGRQKDSSQTLFETRTRQASAASAVLNLEGSVTELKAQFSQLASDNRHEILERDLAQLTRRTDLAEQELSALLPRASTVERMLGSLRESFETDAQQRRDAFAELKNSLFEQTLAAIGDKLEAEGRKQQDAIAALKASLLDEVSMSVGHRLQADERKQQDAIARLQASFENALSAIGDKLEAEGKKRQDAIAALSASLVVSAPPAEAAPSQPLSAESESARNETQIAAAQQAVVETVADTPSIAVELPIAAEPEHPVLDLSTPLDAEIAPSSPHFADKNAAGHHDSIDTPAQYPELTSSAGAGMEALQGAGAFARDDVREESSRSTAYLSSARQSLQAAAARSVPDSVGKEFLSLRFLRSIVAPVTKKGDATSYALIAGIALIAILAVAVTAGELWSRWNSAPGSDVRPTSTAASVRSARSSAAHHVARGAAATQSAGASSSATSQSIAPAQQNRLVVLAKAGNPQAQLLLGLQKLSGGDKADAARWLERAALQGETGAQYRLGSLYAEGRGVPADAAKAFHWYAAAAQGGNRKAMSNLAVAYAQGSGTAKNPQEAARWFSKAAQLGLVDAQFDLAILYERGLGVPQSLLDAYRWYLIGAKAGDLESKDRVEALSSQLTATDRAAAEVAAAQFKPLPMDARANEAQ